MPGAFLTTIFFSLSAIFAQRSIRLFGATYANVARLLCALVILAIAAHGWGQGLGGAGRDWFLLSGVIGMGLGDLAVFGALPRLGSRLSVLITQCLAAPLGALAEWAWLGTKLTGPQMAWGAVILAGVTVALMPSAASPPRVKVTPLGFAFGFMAAAGQGFGAVVSRKAVEVAASAGESVDPVAATYQRILAGFAVAVVYFAAVSLLRRPSGESERKPREARVWRDYLWIPANGLSGAVIGVGCYQWALATTPSGLVLPIVATTPLVIIPLSYWIDGDRPTRRSVVGGVIAVAGAVALAAAR